MKTTRNSIFTPLSPSSLYKKACTAEECGEIGKNEMLQILAEKWGLSRSTLTNSTFFEEQILKHALHIARETCHSIPENMSIAGNASWHVNNKCFEKAFVVRYLGLSLLQREQIVKAYNDHYGVMAMTYEGLYGEGHGGADNQDGIFFNKVIFFQHLQDLIAATQDLRFIA